MSKLLKGGARFVRPLALASRMGTLRVASSLTLSVLAAAAFVAVRPVSAQTYSTGTFVAPTVTTTTIASFTGSLTAGSPTFNRPNGGTPPTTLGTGNFGSSVYYSAYSFNAPTPSATGTTTYGFLSTAGGSAGASFDNFTVLYGGTFNPASPLTNAIVANDDITGTTSGFSGVALTAGNPYTFVTTSYNNTTTGGFTNTITATNTFDPNPAAVTIPDNNTTGISTTLNVSDSFTISNFNSITLQGLNHTYLGDLLITLTHNGTTVDLVDRVGRLANTGFGSSGDFVEANSYTFALTGIAFPTGTTAVPTGTYAPYANGTLGESSTSTATLASFAGMNSSGAWTVNINDRGTGVAGTWRGLFSLNLSPAAAAPEPGTLALFVPALSGMGGMAIVRRRKSKTNG